MRLAPLIAHTENFHFVAYGWFMLAQSHNYSKLDKDRVFSNSISSYTPRLIIIAQILSLTHIINCIAIIMHAGTANCSYVYTIKKLIMSLHVRSIHHYSHFSNIDLHTVRGHPCSVQKVWQIIIKKIIWQGLTCQHKGRWAVLHSQSHWVLPYSNSY